MKDFAKQASKLLRRAHKDGYAYKHGSWWSTELVTEFEMIETPA